MKEMEFIGDLLTVTEVKPVTAKDDPDKVLGYQQEIVLYSPEQVDEYQRIIAPEIFLPFRIFQKAPQSERFIPIDLKANLAVLATLRGQRFKKKDTGEFGYFISFNLLGWRKIKDLASRPTVTAIPGAEPPPF